MNFAQQYNKIKAEYYTVSKRILNYETRRTLADETKNKQFIAEIVAALQQIFKFCLWKFAKT